MKILSTTFPTARRLDGMALQDRESATPAERRYLTHEGTDFTLLRKRNVAFQQPRVVLQRGMVAFLQRAAQCLRQIHCIRSADGQSVVGKVRLPALKCSSWKRTVFQVIRAGATAFRLPAKGDGKVQDFWPAAYVHRQGLTISHQVVAHV